jgi:uncharacterized membrane protein
MTNPRSTASIAGHPIHPMLIPFPVAFFVATLVCDVVFWRMAMRRSQHPRPGCWALAW